MIVLVINSGSSSLKYRLIDMKTQNILCGGICEKIGQKVGIIKYEYTNNKHVEELELETHTVALHKVLDLMLSGETKVINNIKDVGAIGHRVAHGGEIFKESAVITNETLKNIEELAPFAPLHTPFILKGINSAKEIFGENVPNVAVFDTTFHAEMPQKAYLYALPYEFYEKHRIRKFGFHGTSHNYVAEKCAEFLGADIAEMKIISCHLGNGSSITAVKNGKSVDTSMGFTPIAGLPMGTRCGDVDVGAVLYLQEKLDLNSKQMSEVLNKNSGLFGISDVSSDLREIINAYENDNKQARIALEVLTYNLKKYIGSYIAAMNGVDALVFTGGIGENSALIRQKVCEEMGFLGVEIDENINASKRYGCLDISASGSKVKTIVVPTDEEYMIARDTMNLVLNKYNK